MSDPVRRYRGQPPRSREETLDALARDLRRPARRDPAIPSFLWRVMKPFAGVAILGIIFAWSEGALSSITTPLGALSGSDCRIKGNISVNTGERIYHVPGQEYYEETRISREKGERWFCSENDARAAGWRKSRA